MFNPLSPEVLGQYEALTNRAGVVDVSDRTQIEITGKDRVAFLNGFCTNDVEKLVPGAGCEAFLTNAKGKIVAYVYVFCRAESLILETTPGQGSAIISHLNRYVIREDVQIRDLGDQWGELCIAGEESEVALQGAIGEATPPERMGFIACQIRETSIFLHRTALAPGPCFLASTTTKELEKVITALVDVGAIPCSAEALEIVRVESRSPSYGRDITDENFPQEVGRDDQAISFTKGCYLGQETVARIDARGHVNRFLVGVKADAARALEPGEELASAGRTVGRITSAVWSPRFKAPLALAYVRRGHHLQGGSLELIRDRSKVVVFGFS
ncbi:MAG: folate-binding protein YgfZ [Planctomycetes bacterium]|nr:folate-binding protein YgfZ [Planctomycetota bacterium]MBL7040987.1 folate-binding protein YgfZ [Pirellulaceae bacterium]